MITIGNTLKVDRLPPVCPWCKRSIRPAFKALNEINSSGMEQTFHTFFQCSAEECLKGIIAIYARTGGMYTLEETYPKLPNPPSVDDEIGEISPNFVEIYKQAGIADSTDLDQIAGVGYRKALEFLVKDYCCHKQPEKEDEIKRATLSQVISKYVENSNVKACSVRAAWLGNDETHYIRKWEDKDISDLKMLINLACAWIKTEVLTEKYMKDMDKQ